MSEFNVIFHKADGAIKTIRVPSGTLLSDAAQDAGLEIGLPCGGQGRCGRCIVQVQEGSIRQRSTNKLTKEAVENNYVLACQSIIQSDISIFIPEQEKIERKLNTDQTAADVLIPDGYDFNWSQNIRRVEIFLNEPSMDDQTDDWNRVKSSLRKNYHFDTINGSLSLIRRMGSVLRDGSWHIFVVFNLVDKNTIDIIDILPYSEENEGPVYAAAIDIGTTTVSFWLVDLSSGAVKAQAADYNSQIGKGEDVISRIIFSAKEKGLSELQGKVVETINSLSRSACKRAGINSSEIIKATIAGNSTMIHLLLGIPANTIRYAPFITTVNHPPLTNARELGLNFCPDAIVDSLPGVASYVGADITAGVLSSELDITDKVTLFIDVGTNGEIVFGNRDWLVTCACSAGPAFEGAGVQHGMRATKGAIEEVWINGANFEPAYRVIGSVTPKGICGSGLISILAEMFITGIVDKKGNINLSLPTRRVRMGEHGAEYVVCWKEDIGSDQDIFISRVDIDNLIRAKAAIYAGFTVLAEQVGLSLENVEQMFIGGSFGKYINVEKAIQIGLLPDMPWEKFKYLGNTSIKGAYFTLLSNSDRERIETIAGRMTYIELSADNTFYEAFTSALFLPHTDIAKFPSLNFLFSTQSSPDLN